MNKILPICLCTLWLTAAGGWTATPKAVDIELLGDESSVYVLYSDGYLQTTGFAVSLGYPSKVDAIDLVFTPSKDGYYILEQDGTLHTYGDAIELAAPMKDTRTPFVDMELFQTTNNPYFLKQDGSIVTVGNTPFFGDSVRDTDAVDLELTPDGLGYYVLYEDGTIAFFGTAINRGFTETRKIKAVDLELESSGYYVALADGSILTFGDVVPMPFTINPADNVTDMILSDRGYRILTTTGEVHDFLRVDGQGTTSWYAQVSARSVSPKATATPTQTPTQTPTPTRTPRADVGYFLIDGSGFAEKAIGKIPDGSSLPASLDSGYASLFGGGLFVVASEGDDLPARKILYYSLENSKDKNSTGKVFASLSSERGAAIIRGIAYSKAGLYVVVQDDSGTFIYLLEGTFEAADIQGFSLY